MHRAIRARTHFFPNGRQKCSRVECNHLNVTRKLPAVSGGVRGGDSGRLLFKVIISLSCGALALTLCSVVSALGLALNRGSVTNAPRAGLKKN